MLVPHIHFIFYVAPYYSIIWILCDIFHQSSINECFGYFCVLIIINSAPANILECRLLRTCSNISVGKILKTGTGSQRLYLFEVWCVLSDHPPKVLNDLFTLKKCKSIFPFITSLILDINLLKFCLCENRKSFLHIILICLNPFSHLLVPVVFSLDVRRETLSSFFLGLLLFSLFVDWVHGSPISTEIDLWIW